MTFAARARAITELAAAHAAAGESAGQLAPEVASAILSAGLFRMMVPAAIGGGEASPLEMIEAIDALSQGDGAAGWILMIGATTGASSVQLPLEGAREVFGDPAGLVVGAVVPKGIATRVEGGFRLSGVWPFGSGTGHATWITGGAVVVGPDGPEMVAEKVPHTRMMFFPRSAVSIKDTWHVSGLRSTGSNDFEVADVFVPEHHSYAMGTRSDWAEGRTYHFPFFGLLAVGVAAVATGIARAAITELKSLAAAKTPSGSRRLLAERAAAQSGVAEAEALLRSGRGFMFDTVRDVWERAQAGARIGNEDKAMIRLAATTATLNSTRAVDICYNLGGATSIYSDNLLQRHFRDVHTVTQHVMVGQPTLEVAGRILLGLPTDTSTL
ncbi:MAG: acyl-CoA dehydrogenase family protein [Dehalococcoidia bacterium]